MPLNQLLSADRITILVEPGDRGDVLDTAARLLADVIPGGTGSALLGAIADSLRAREQLASTAIGHGVAIPHARLPMIEESRGAFLRLSKPIDFNAADGQPVDLILAMAVPEHDPHKHLQQLAELAERFGSATFRDRLRAAGSITQLRGLLLSPETRRSAA